MNANRIKYIASKLMTINPILATQKTDYRQLSLGLAIFVCVVDALVIILLCVVAISLLVHFL